MSHYHRMAFSLSPSGLMMERTFRLVLLHHIYDFSLHSRGLSKKLAFWVIKLNNNKRKIQTTNHFRNIFCGSANSILHTGESLDRYLCSRVMNRERIDRSGGPLEEPLHQFISGQIRKQAMSAKYLINTDCCGSASFCYLLNGGM